MLRATRLSQFFYQATRAMHLSQFFYQATSKEGRIVIVHFDFQIVCFFYFLVLPVFQVIGRMGTPVLSLKYEKWQLIAKPTMIMIIFLKTLKICVIVKMIDMSTCQIMASQTSAHHT